MFKRIFTALANLTGNIEALAASIAEANECFRHNVLGEGNGDLLALDHQAESQEPARLGRKKTAAK
jgi:hypothetical protein